MDAYAITCITLGVSLITGCRSAPRDQCLNPPPPPTTSTANIKFLANVEPQSFIGLVLDSATKRPLRGVSVLVEDMRIGANSDSLGIFRFRSLPIGDHRLQLRRIGYAIVSDTITISAISGSVGVYDLPNRSLYLCNVILTT